MKITSHDISFQSSHQFLETEEAKTEFRGLVLKDGDSIDISSRARSRFYNRTFSETEGNTLVKKIDESRENGNNSSKILISEMASAVTGMDVSIVEENRIKARPEPRRNLGSMFLSEGSLLTDTISVSFSHTITREIKEQTIVNSGGVVTTEDGREISFDLHLEMDRHFQSMEESRVNRNINQLIDPIVIQFEDGPPSVSNNVFSFDLNGDGDREELRSLGKGSGFLAFDKNNDGKINDGTELFGTQTGKGFAELAQYDEDGNGWIDENDSIFEKLSVWRPETDGESEFMSGLLSADVGAIYLGYASSDHTISDEKGNTLAKLKSTGTFLKESGKAGHVYEMDLADLRTDKKLKTPMDNGSLNMKNIEAAQKVIEQLENFNNTIELKELKIVKLPDRNYLEEFSERLKKQIEELKEAIAGKNEINDYEEIRIEPQKHLNFNI